MKTAISILFLFSIILALGQKGQDKLVKEKQKLEKKINQTKSLLSKVQSNSMSSLQEVRLLESQIQTRENLMALFDDQIKQADVLLLEKGDELIDLDYQLERLKSQYKSLVIQAYKQRSQSGKLMYLLSAESFNVAMKRNYFLRQVANSRKKQATLILLKKNQLEQQMGSINLDKTQKLIASNEKIYEKQRIELDKKKKEENYNKLKSDESSLLSQLRSDEEKKRKIGKQIQDAILAEEIKEAERKKKAAAKKTTKSSNTKNNTANKKTTSASPKPTTQKSGTSSKIDSEGSVVGSNFEANKGSLPSPVSSGSITGRFGKVPHSQLKNVYENNNGIDITCLSGTSVRAVFDGEVSSILSIPGAGYVVIIKHGSYRSVYSNLCNVSVKSGTKVSMKQAIGTLASSGNLSILHFEIHRVSGQSTLPQNPLIWINH